MRIVKKYWLPLLALVLAIGLAVWRIGYLERTNTSLSIEIGSREALQNGEPITLENPVILYKNEPYMPLKEIVERLGGTTDGKTYTLHGAETAVSGVYLVPELSDDLGIVVLIIGPVRYCHDGVYCGRH